MLLSLTVESELHPLCVGGARNLAKDFLDGVSHENNSLLRVDPPAHCGQQALTVTFLSFGDEITDVIDSSPDRVDRGGNPHDDTDWIGILPRERNPDRETWCDIHLWGNKVGRSFIPCRVRTGFSMLSTRPRLTRVIIA